MAVSFVGKIMGVEVDDCSYKRFVVVGLIDYKVQCIEIAGGTMHPGEIGVMFGRSFPRLTVNVRDWEGHSLSQTSLRM
jgi:hypothetical protein